MKRPIIIVLIFYIIGILAGQYLQPVSLALFFVLITLLCSCMYLKLKWKPVFILILFAGLGFLRFQQGLPPAVPTRHIRAGEEVMMTGIVRDFSYTSTGRQKILFHAGSLYFREEAYERPLKIQAVLPAGEEVSVGDRLKLAGILQSPEKKRNPGGFDEEVYFYTHGIQYKTFPLVVEKEAALRDYRVYIYRLRAGLSQVYDSLLPEKEAAIIKSMIIGDKSGLREDVKDFYRMAGIYHILAISGLHISILALFMHRLLFRFLGRKPSGLAVIGFLIMYCLFTGNSVSTVRAVIMSAVVIAAPLLFRSSDLLASTAFACFCLLLYRPFYLWDIGFQYSFASVFGIAVAALPMERLAFFLRKGMPFLQPVLGHRLVKNGIGSSLAATLATCPVAAFHFYYFLPYSFIVNMLIIPTVFVVVLLGFLTGILGMLHYGLALFLSGTLYYSLSIYEWICRFFVSLPGSAILCGSWPLPVVLLFYISFGALVILLLRYDAAFRQFKRWYYISAILFAVSYGAWKLWPKPPEVTMLDVGQGDCFVIRSQDRCYIIDGGGWLRWPGSNTGRQVIAPFLDYYAVDFVDGVFVTHRDADHIIGIIELLEEKEIGTIYLPALSSEPEPENLIDTLIYSAEKYKIPISYLKKGDITGRDDVIFHCLNPAGASAGDNASSLVLKLTLNRRDFLFTGDIDDRVEEELLQANIQADVLKAAHHGSKYSSSQGFLQAVEPSLTLISAGARNAYGHPGAETLERLEALNIPYYITAERGAVRVQIRNGSLYIQTMI